MAFKICLLGILSFYNIDFCLLLYILLSSLLMVILNCFYFYRFSWAFSLEKSHYLERKSLFFLFLDISFVLFILSVLNLLYDTGVAKYTREHFVTKFKWDTVTCIHLHIVYRWTVVIGKETLSSIQNLRIWRHVTSRRRVAGPTLYIAMIT